MELGGPGEQILASVSPETETDYGAFGGPRRLQVVARRVTA